MVRKWCVLSLENVIFPFTKFCTLSYPKVRV